MIIFTTHWDKFKVTVMQSYSDAKRWNANEGNCCIGQVPSWSLYKWATPSGFNENRQYPDFLCHQPVNMTAKKCRLGEVNFH